MTRTGLLTQARRLLADYEEKNNPDNNKIIIQNFNDPLPDDLRGALLIRLAPDDKKACNG